ncbi:malignant T-cell-amplified sequence 1-like [Paramacrobiotus metropolitanus]|uniref:malignant T-cell-amplified sequence 1-like n=1 Tax=Paramacrobiotus metropolitanus TaxID=2943436 RepID=UPI0024462664|nr:malignant T-cell-amplified sequence 1-like [Paramacrobiotus metropolitanus]
MFKKFSEKESVTGSSQLKSSVIRNYRQGLLEKYPHVESYLDEIWPKKDNVKLVKCQDHIELIASQTGDILFFKHRDGPMLPSLRVLHKYPFILPWMQVDKGAIKFVLSGANIMCPGLTSPGGKMSIVEKDTPVLIVAEGKQHALGIGVMKMSTEAVRKTNKGIAVDLIHFLNDGLWQMKSLK